MTPEQMATLQAVWDAYQHWVEASRARDEQLAAAEAAQAGLPIDALQGEFDAQIALSRTVIEFAATCPPEGPETAGRPGAAVVQSIFQSVTPELADELDELERGWPAWIAAARKWTPGDAQLAPGTAAPLHAHVLATVDTWGEFENDAMRDKLIGMLVGSGGQQVMTTGHVSDDGHVVEVTRFRFDPPEPGQRSVGVFGRLRAWFRRSRS